MNGSGISGGLILAAPASGAGKTTVTLALLRLLTRQGLAVRGAKSGPDYIDPRFHQAACGQSCVNLDAWAMSPERITALAAGDGLLLIEGAMGLFDGAPPDGRGSVADLARILRLPVLLVVDAARMAQSVAPLCAGFANHDPEVSLAGVILNNVGSPRHGAMLRQALRPLGLPVLAALPRDPSLALPSRHLGLIQAEEHADLEVFLDQAADWLAPEIDLTALLNLAQPLPAPAADAAPRLAPPAQRIAVARDAAFAFAYPHLLQEWHDSGAEITFFSPLADDPVPEAGFVYLPGGYPELHAGRLAANTKFLNSLRARAADTPIYGECGGYMLLGRSLTDAAGQVHEMAGLLGLDCSFAERRLHLGYRYLSAEHGPFPTALRGHEFHYATTLRAEGAPLFDVRDAEGRALPAMGLRRGNVCGSFAHVIDRDTG
ncbi:cobyrinate a,c-diamide synthase [Pseudooceanicola sp.]|uniref:cobyrinate a,c-diamide synthase n=1 Tax=Pseudooceanicola sp. TaxID=1914328 RepID=UPI00262BDDCC|nr:cobyrinate a,c-diamide synthase [Pseudooceanicola sp.]MDF1854330.1 cobyrinate a,c-diamide synthase [Pseudooceanicola sp.]